jgi:hypothetical protein
MRMVLSSIAGDAWQTARRELMELGDDHFPFPADVVVGLGADALSLARPSRAAPISFVDVRRRYLPEYEHRGNTAHQKSRAALHLAVTDQDLALYSFEALVIMLRIAAARSGRPVAEFAESSRRRTA